MSNVRNNGEQNRFELEVAGNIAFSEYTRKDTMLVIGHTEVPQALSGRGIGSTLVRGMLDLVRAEGLKVRPLCPFVKAFMDRHPEYADLRV